MPSTGFDHKDSGVRFDIVISDPQVGDGIVELSASRSLGACDGMVVGIAEGFRISPVNLEILGQFITAPTSICDRPKLNFTFPLYCPQG